MRPIIIKNADYREIDDRVISDIYLRAKKLNKVDEIFQTRSLLRSKTKVFTDFIPGGFTKKWSSNLNPDSFNFENIDAAKSMNEILLYLEERYPITQTH